MIVVSEYWRYIEQININPQNAIRMATMAYHNGVISLPDYLKIRGKLEERIKQKLHSK